ncbi:carbohydrate porin [Ectothiorhodospiraceae bacterium 2226]|nr:carbohydrate porin [Ectothiorhodospiraceae bacterium 2226]
MNARWRKLPTAVLLGAAAAGPASAASAAAADEGIAIGGAVRFQYSYEPFDQGNRERRGDIDFDTFRINVDGTRDEMELAADFRHYAYMNVVKFGWVGYRPWANTQLRAGIVPVPFGNRPLTSHNFFFSTHYYVGLEDDHDLGVAARVEQGPWRLDLALLKNDEHGGVDGFVSDRTHRYSYDVLGVRAPAEGLHDAPGQPLGEANTAAARIARTLAWGPVRLTPSLSGLYGELHDLDARAGDSRAWALAVDADYGRWNLKAQLSDYRHRVNDAQLLAVGAYAFYDTIPASARIASVNLARSLPVTFGPISELQFYNNYSLLYRKSGDLNDTWKNVTGMLVQAGPVSTYIDYIVARDHPFIGGSLASGAGERHRRLNINVGYYF